MVENPGETWARIEGKIDLLNERQSRTNDDVRDLRDRANSHSNRITIVEREIHLREGEQKGFDKAVRAMYALATVSGLGTIAAIVKILVTGD
jgi:peptidoglycan hydrolase CwlO-like protein